MNVIGCVPLAGPGLVPDVTGDGSAAGRRTIQFLPHGAAPAGTTL